jgi:hypothetical protein
MSPRKKCQTIKEEAATELFGNRRSKQRFPIDFPLSYKLMRNGLVTSSGTGMTVDMSSGGIAFTVDEKFKIGAYIELSVSWPVLLNGSCPMKLVVEGRVVRSDGQSTAIRTERHEFRTQRRAVAQPQQTLLMMAAAG